MDRSIFSNKKAKKQGRAFHDLMTPNFWRAHHVIPAFIALAGLGVALGIAHFSTWKPYRAHAGAAENIWGWAWASNIGWVSLNSDNPSSCTLPPASCGSYGLDVAEATSSVPSWDFTKPPGTMTVGHEITGFVWSDNVGFICFGRSCDIAACSGTNFPDPPYHPSPPLPAPNATANKFYAYVDPITDATPKKVHGWAVICNQKDAGWISLNCQDTGTCNDPAQAGDRNYRLVYNPSDKNFYSDPFGGVTAASAGVSFGWNGNSDASGIGYLSFFPSAMGMRLRSLTEICNNKIDDDLNSLIDCQDPQCSLLPICQAEVCNNADDNANGVIDDGPGMVCAQSTVSTCEVVPGCSGTRQCSATCTWATACTAPAENCTNGVDDDCDGKVDNLDPDCIIDQPQCESSPDPKCQDPSLTPAQKAECCCNDGDDNDSGQGVDCIDPKCVAQAPAVCSAWAKVVTGNIYATGGFTGTQAPKALNTGNVKYCLRANGEIQWTSEESCTQTGVDLKLPTNELGYRTQLGFIDLEGIRKGRYGTVKQIFTSSDADLPSDLGGKVYQYIGNLPFDLQSKTFQNGTTLGNGLLLIDGADLNISGDIGYDNTPVTGSLKKLASFGVIVVKNTKTGSGGNVTISPSVTKVSGTYFAEGTFRTGTCAPNCGGIAGTYDKGLKLFGILVAKQFKLERDNNDPLNPAEEIIFDGRAIANPPPGMQDITKSLPKMDVSF